MQITLTSEMITALLVAFDELSNSGDWAEFYSSEQLQLVYEGIEQFKNLELVYPSEFNEAQNE